MMTKIKASSARRTAGSLKRIVRLLPAIAEVIQKEIHYHRKRRGSSGKTADWEIGFLDGLCHAHDLVLKIIKRQPDEKADA
jgi:hypothetical protein